MFHDGMDGGLLKEAPARQERATAPLPLSARETSLPIKRVSRRTSLRGEERTHEVWDISMLHKERSATRLQAVTRGKLVRKLNLARLAAGEQQAAVARLRAQRHAVAPGQGSLPPSTAGRSPSAGPSAPPKFGRISEGDEESRLSCDGSRLYARPTNLSP